MSFISLMKLQCQDSVPRVEQELFHWRIRIDSEVELDLEHKQGAEEEHDHRRSFLIPKGSKVIALIVDSGEIIKKIYQAPNGEKSQ